MWTVLLERGLLTDTPATTTGALNNKDVILIKMRAYAATGNREGDHQIVQTPVGQGAEGAHQRAGRFVPMVHGLNQQRPVAFAQMVVTFKWAMFDLPCPVKVAHQSAIHLIFHRQTGQFIR
ncbi:Uncharacterised protein [Kluyvera intermedia]|nr:Uncharacterised protein [Kluyvera intermedia]